MSVTQSENHFGGHLERYFGRRRFLPEWFEMTGSSWSTMGHGFDKFANRLREYYVVAELIKGRCGRCHVRGRYCDVDRFFHRHCRAVNR